MLKRNIYTVLSATIGGGIASCITAGIDGKGEPLNFIDIVFNGLPAAAQLSSFPLSVQLLSKISPSFRQIAKNKDREQAKFYIIGGIGACAIYTAITYPASILQENRKMKKTGNKPKKSMTMKGFTSAYIDRLGISIGFTWSMNALQSITPHSKNSIVEWARKHVLVCGANVTARVAAFPILKVRHGAKLSNMLIKYLKNTPNVMITGDCVAAVRQPLSFLIE